MKKYLVILLLVPLALALLLTLPGCFGPSAEQILKDATKADKDLTTVHFVAESTQKLPRAPIQNGQVQKQVYVQKSDGDINLQTKNERVKPEIAPGIPVTKLQVGDKQFWQLAGNWYDVPASAQDTIPATQFLSVSQYIKSFKTINKLGDTSIDGEAVYHLQAEPDMKEFVKLPIITDLLKDANGNQVRTVDELAEAKIVLDLYVIKKNDFFKRETVNIAIRANQELIKLGYAQAGDKVTLLQNVTFSNFNEKLTFQAPSKVSPLPTKS
jgi:hypothetical protein